MRAWYLRRAIPWVALLGCCSAAVAAALLLARWPSAEEALLPVVLGCCAAAAGFAFDEPLPALAEVSPRGATWRRTTRMLSVGLPGLVWAVVLVWRPGRVPEERSGWWLAGAASIALLAGIAALAARRGVATPGAVLAAWVAVAMFVPVLVSIMLGWLLVYPFGEVTDGIVTFWVTVAAVGVASLGVGLRPGLGR